MELKIDNMNKPNTKRIDEISAIIKVADLIWSKDKDKSIEEVLMCYQNKYNYLEKFILIYIFLLSKNKNIDLLHNWQLRCFSTYIHDKVDMNMFKEYLTLLLDRLNITTEYVEPTSSIFVNEFGTLKQLK